ncbi:MAG: NAD(P)/FAD-dependent oxidoreductase [Candidatus Bathyarchaeia archaeon]
MERDAEGFDVLVVGAGPCGLIAAREAASRGLRVVVVEEHQEIGLPVHCAGLLSAEGLKAIGVPPSSHFVLNEVRGANFHSPTGLSFTVEGRRAFVANRTAFDKAIATQAARLGAGLRLGFKAERLEAKSGFVSGVVGGDGESIGASITIDAEGYGCRLLRGAGMKTPDPRGLIPAVQMEVAGVDVDPDYVDVFVGREVAPGFFAWIIPMGPDSAKVGLASRGANPRALLQRFVRERIGSCQALAVQAGCVSTGGPSSRTYGDGILIVGDAAGQTKATTGGGVITGGICAKIAGETAAEAVLHDDVSSKHLQNYERRWRKRLGREFNTMLWARRVANALSDTTIDRIFRAVIRDGLVRVIEEEGEIDFQSLVLRRLAMHPSILSIIAHVISDILLP